MSRNQKNNGRRDFLKGTALATGALVTQSWRSENTISQKEDLPLRNEENASYLAFFDPVEGPVPNPGMGVSGYVYSDHMYKAFSNEERNRVIKLPPLELDRQSFERFVNLPCIDNLYIRYDWKDVQKQRGKLFIPDAWKWLLEASEKTGKRWSFRVMNCNKESMTPNSLPDFLQGKLKMVSYWNGTDSRGPETKYFPEYSEDYLNYWGELVAMLGEEFDNHPLLEYADISGYGFWGEMHHFAQYKPNELQKNYQPGIPEQVEAIIDRLIKDHLKAFPKTPAVLNLHAAEYKAGIRAFEEGLCWPRRDSFEWGFSTTEVRVAQGLMPGSAMVWEVLRPGMTFSKDSEIKPDSLFPIPQRYFDISANYASMGFNPWDAIWASENCQSIYQLLQQKIGYRLRPSIVWHRKLHNKTEIALGLRNDGCVAPPGQITIEALFENGKKAELKLPLGEPAPGAMKIYTLPFHGDISDFESEKKVELTMKLQMKGKSAPVQWAVKNSLSDNNLSLKIPLKTYTF